MLMKISHTYFAGRMPPSRGKGEKREGDEKPDYLRS